MHPDVCVVYLLRELSGSREVLLGRKLTGLGAGKFVGPGGKLEPGESAADAAVREVEEEIGVLVEPNDLAAVGELTYVFPHKPQWTQRSWAFIATQWTGTPRRSSELDPKWFDISAVPLEAMWDDARLWLPGALAGKSVKGYFEFGLDNATVTSSSISVEA